MLRPAAAHLIACTLVWALIACKSLDEGLLRPPSGIVDAGGDATLPVPDAQLPETDAGRDGDVGGPCTKSEETCNGKDDDCDQKVDEGGDQWCEDNLIEHAPAVCEAMNGSALCFKFGACNDGFDSCDGDPANGCEADYCDCNACDDAGTDDAGS